MESGVNCELETEFDLPKYHLSSFRMDTTFIVTQCDFTRHWLLADARFVFLKSTNMVCPGFKSALGAKMVDGFGTF